MALSATVLTAVSDLTVDASSAINITWTVYDEDYTHTLDVKAGDITILTITGLTSGAGKRRKAIPLTSARKRILLTAMRTVKTLNVAYVLTTYSGSTQIGGLSTVTGTIRTTESISRPTFADFTFCDSNNTTVNVTGDNERFVQARSLLKVVCDTAIANNQASIVSYRATVGEKVVVSDSTVISFGAIPDTGNLRLTVAAVDSRGYETSVTKTITVVDYKDITIDSYNIRRRNNAEDVIQLDFSGTLSPIVIDEAAKNALMSAKYRTKNASSFTWSNYKSMEGVERSESSFSFSHDDWITLASVNDYYVQVEVSDKLSTNTITLYISKGQPLVAFREGKVGINTNDPQSALDVNGDIRATGTVKMNDRNVQGFVGELEAETDLNNVLTSGIYYVPLSGNIQNRPVTNSVAVLEVIEVTSVFILQRFTCVDGKVYCRGKYNTTWHNWA